jgi:diguanylate cyclase (GGDEF)-like protein
VHKTEGVVGPDSPYAAQLERGFRRLLFEPAIEREFRAEYAEQNLRRQRVGFLLASVLYILFLAIKLLTESGPAFAWGVGIRVTIISSMLIAVALSYTALRRHQSVFMFVTYVIFGTGVTGIEIVGNYYDIERHYEGLIFITVHAYVFSGLVYRQAFAAALYVFVVYLVGGWLGGLAGKQWGYELFFMALLNMLGAFALYQLERVERENFLRRRLLNEMATRDGLTGLPNRTAFLEHFGRVLRQAARESRTLGLVMLDLDHFKAYNDRYGHIEGDEVLRRIAPALQAHFQRPLDMFARYAGEEFVGLWYGIDPVLLQAQADAVRAGLAEMNLVHEKSPLGRVTASVGAIAFQPAGNESLLELIRRADRVLYAVKDQGRNAVFVEDLPGPVYGSTAAVQPA